MNTNHQYAPAPARHPAAGARRPQRMRPIVRLRSVRMTQLRKVSPGCSDYESRERFLRNRPVVTSQAQGACAEPAALHGTKTEALVAATLGQEDGRKRPCQVGKGGERGPDEDSPVRWAMRVNRSLPPDHG